MGLNSRWTHGKEERDTVKIEQVVDVSQFGTCSRKVGEFKFERL